MTRLVLAHCLLSARAPRSRERLFYCALRYPDRRSRKASVIETKRERAGSGARWLQVCRPCRGWAFEHPLLPLVTAAVIGLPPDPAYADLVKRPLVRWVVLLGSLSFELLRHLEDVITGRGALFDAAMGRAVEGAGLRVPTGAQR